MRAMVLALAISALSGCAHGWSGANAARELRGSAKVGQTPRLLVGGGRALSLHTTLDGSEAIALYVVDRVNGDDRDCATSASSHPIAVARGEGHHLELGEGRELCAMGAAAAREVTWHGREAEPTTVVARK